MAIEAIARPEIRRMKPYGSARSEIGRVPVLLNANENPFDPTGAGLNRYPDPQPAPLLDALGGRYGVPPEQILATRGSDEAIDLLVRVFCRAGQDAVLYCPPTFGMYRIAAETQGAAMVTVPLRSDHGFDLDVDGVIAALEPNVRLVFLCSPNNPTGNVIPRDQLLAVVEAARDRALVVVDEAYVEFADAGIAALIDANDNLAVLRTLSKAWGLAGARCGAVIADPSVIGLLRRIMPPYPLPTPTIEAALTVLDEPGRRRMADEVTHLVAARDALAAALAAHPVVEAVFPSRANFVLVRVRNADRVLEAALGAGIALRDMRAQPALDGCVRISVGTPEEMDRLAVVLDELAREAA